MNSNKYKNNSWAIFRAFLNTKCLKSWCLFSMYSIPEFTEWGAGGCHIGQCRSRRKGGHEETNSGKEPGATYGMTLGLLPAEIWHWHVRTFGPALLLSCLVPWPVCSLRQVCFGAVQRSVLAHVQSGHPGPYLLPSRPLCGAHSVVQRHHEYTLIGKALVLSGSVPSPRNLSPRNLLHSANTPLPPLETTLHSPALWLLLSRHMSFLQCSLPEWLTDTSLMDLETSISSDFQPVLWCVRPQTTGPQEVFCCWFSRGKQKRQYPFCTRVCVFSLCLIRAV